jgi:hypothetical protein
MLDDTSQFGQPDDAIPRQEADVADAGQEQHVVLAQSPERDGPSQHQVAAAVVVGERGEPERLGLEQFRIGTGIRAGVARRCSRSRSTPSAVRNTAAACATASRSIGLSVTISWSPGRMVATQRVSGTAPQGPPRFAARPTL